MFDKIDLSGRYVKYELLPNYEEYNALSKQFSIGSLSDIYMTDVGMVFPEVKQREIEVEREISVSIKGSSLVSEDQTTSLKVKFITKAKASKNGPSDRFFCIDIKLDLRNFIYSLKLDYALSS